MQIYNLLCKYIQLCAIYSPVPLSGNCSVVSMFWLESFFHYVYSWADLIHVLKTCNVLKDSDGKTKACRYFLTYSYLWKENQLLTLHVHAQSQRYFLPLSHEIPLSEWQKRCIPEAHDSSTPRDVACSCGWGNRWALFGAVLDTQFFCTVKSLGTALKAFKKKICEPLNISTSVVRTELSECLWFQLIPISQKLAWPAFKICSHKGALTYLQHSSILHICRALIQQCQPIHQESAMKSTRGFTRACPSM